MKLKDYIEARYEKPEFGSKGLSKVEKYCKDVGRTKQGVYAAIRAGWFVHDGFACKKIYDVRTGEKHKT